MITPLDFGLPFDSFRPLQLETACHIAASAKEFIILQAPPGSGKSLLAATAARLMASGAGLASDKGKAVITVGTKQLQEQYQETLGIPTIMGRANFLCQRLNGAASCEFGPCTIDRGCSRESKWQICPYYKQKLQARTAPEAVLNIAYFLNEANHVGMFSKNGFLILDEAHLLEQSLTQFIGIKFSQRGLLNYGISLPRGKINFQVLSRWAEAALIEANFRLRLQEERVEMIPGIPGASEVKSLTQLQGLIWRLHQLSAACVELGEWAIYREPTNLEVKPIHAARFTRGHIFKHSKKKLLMSATILDWEDMATALGIPLEQVDWIELPATFPAENRPVNYWPVVKVKGQEIDLAAGKLALAIDSILKIFPQEKGVIHAVSHELTRKIVQRSKSKDRLVHHLTRPREEAINEFLTSSEPLVLISPSITIGLDLPDDTGRFQIIAKLQFPSLGDPIVQARLKLSDSWYAAQTARSLIQACGRAVRHKTDHAVSFILDQNFTWFSKKYAHMIPQWWRDSLYRIEDLDQAVMPDQS